MYRQRKVVIAAISDAPVQWFRANRSGKPFLIVFGDLLRAVQTESAGAVANHWGVSTDTVSNWRRALKVGRITRGTVEVYRDLFEVRLSEDQIKRGRKKSRSRSAKAKMVASKAGQPMHPNTRTALLSAVRKPKSEAHRQAMSRAHKARGTLPPNGIPWKRSEDRRLGKAPDKLLAEEFGRSMDSVRKRRTRLKIPKYSN